MPPRWSARCACSVPTPSWSYGDRKGPAQSLWPHAKAFLLVEYVKLQHGTVIERYDRMYVSSLDPNRLTTAQWLLLVRSHWGVENQNHHTLDTAFAEDDLPWIEADANGMLAVLLLRRVAYTLLALFRAVTLRSDEHRAMRWKSLLAWVRDALVGRCARAHDEAPPPRGRRRRTLKSPGSDRRRDIAGREGCGLRGRRRPALAAA